MADPTNTAWGTDVPVSIPVPPAEEIVRSAGGGFAYSRFGLVHEITTSDVETFLFPTHAPLDTPERD
jgi:hypothetical protein